MNLDELRDNAMLTDEAIDALVLQEFPDFPIHDEGQYARGLARIMVDAARDKALAAAFEATGPLAKALECTLADHTSDKHKHNCTCPAWDGYRAALADYQALKLGKDKFSHGVVR